MSRLQAEPPVLGYFKGFLFFLFLLLSASMYMFLISLVTVPLLLLEYVTPKSFYKNYTRPIYHTLNTLAFANWSMCVGRLLVWVYGMKFYVTPILNNPGEGAENKTNTIATPKTPAAAPSSTDFLSQAFSAPPAGKVNVIIMNHRTVLDWLLLWGAFAQCETGSAFRSLKIVPKATLSTVPIFGWAMQGFRFLFLSRKSTEGDLATLAAAAESYCQEPSTSSIGPTILIFPEGTDLSQVHVQKSHEFCSKNGLPLWNKVLAPRALGLGHFLRSVGKDRIHQVLDFTIAYEDYILKERPGESSLIKGRAPQAMHIAIRRFVPQNNNNNASSSSSSEDQKTAFPLPDFVFQPGPNLTTANPKLDKWIRGLFALKEHFLTNFYRQREDEKKLTAKLQSPCLSNEKNAEQYNDEALEMFFFNNGSDHNSSANAERNSGVISSASQLEQWLPTRELRLRSFRSILERIILPWLICFMAVYLNYRVFGFFGFVGITLGLFAFARYVVIKKPIHLYFFEEYFSEEDKKLILRDEKAGSPLKKKEN